MAQALNFYLGSRGAVPVRRTVSEQVLPPTSPSTRSLGTVQSCVSLYLRSSRQNAFISVSFAPLAASHPA